MEEQEQLEQPTLALEGEQDESPTLSVGELTTQVRDTMRRAFPAEVWVRGEVQNLTRSSAGHTYFSLVEKAGRGDRVQARLDVVLFRDDRRAVARALADVPGSELGNDVEVRIRGRVTVYPGLGRLQLVMSGIDPVFTVGGIAANRERVLRALASDGVLDANARLTLPAVPLRVGLITSTGSAAYHDFVHELERTGYAWRVCAVDVRVQGAAAARRIKWALSELAKIELDAVVLVRGGGSRADLAPFDSELVARDRRHAGAGAHRRGSRNRQQRRRRGGAQRAQDADCVCPRAGRAGAYVLGAARRALAPHRRAGASARRGRRPRSSTTPRCASDAGGPPRWLVNGARVEHGRDRLALLGREFPITAGRKLDTSARRVAELGRRSTREAMTALDGRERALVSLGNHHLSRASLRVEAAESVVRALDPRRVLERGYSITRDEQGRIVRRVTDTGTGAVLVTELADGRVASRVERVVEDVE